LYKLTTISALTDDLKHFGEAPDELWEFLRRNGLDGLEATQSYPEDMACYPQDALIGLHMRYWPTCLDFFRRNTKALTAEFGNAETIELYYGAASYEQLICDYRAELVAAEARGCSYAVVHVSHATIPDSFTFRYDYTDSEVTDAFVDFMNAVLDGYDGKIEVLFENLWWPGLTLLDETIAHDLLDRVKYANTGFMLDVGHMLITNPELTTYGEAAAYVEGILLSRPFICSHIRGIHMHGGLSGEYVKSIKSGGCMARDIGGDYWVRYSNVYEHVFKIDRHLPFADAAAQRIVELATPEYFVHELSVKSLAKLERGIEIQRACCGLN
jgi:sugar phosphate isomerase/epimerase